MKNFNRPLYFCTECKKVVEKVDELLFVEEDSAKGFCSESCIEDFYHPIIRHFELLEMKIRKELGIENEIIYQKKDDKDLIEEVLNSPGEVWQIKNDFNESLYYYFRHFTDYSAIIICSVFNKQASFVFFKTVTRSKPFLNAFRPPDKESELIKNERTQGEAMSEDDFLFMQELENKKSTLLAELLMKRKEDDISFEEFSHYEYCFQECLEEADEVFETKDREGDVFFVYIKSFIRETQNFFYIISCLKRKDPDNADEVNVFPALAFPTNDVELYLEFRKGKCVSGPLKN